MSRIAHDRSKSVNKSFFLGANPQTPLNHSLPSTPQSNISGHVTGAHTQIMTRDPLALSTDLSEAFSQFYPGMNEAHWHSHQYFLTSLSTVTLSDVEDRLTIVVDDLILIQLF